MAEGKKVENAVSYDGEPLFGSVSAKGVKGAKPKSPDPDED